MFYVTQSQSSKSTYLYEVIQTTTACGGNMPNKLRSTIKSLTIRPKM